MSAPISITDLLNEVGSKKLEVQFVHQCLKGAKECKDHTEIRLGTNKGGTSAILAGELVGVVVWMNGDEYRTAVETLKKRGAA